MINKIKMSAGRESTYSTSAHCRHQSFAIILMWVTTSRIIIGFLYTPYITLRYEYRKLLVKTKHIFNFSLLY